MIFYRPNYIKFKAYLFILICSLFISGNSYSNSYSENLVDKNLSNITVDSFEWSMNLQDTQPSFKEIIINNNSELNLKSITFEIQLYDDKNVMYTFVIIKNQFIKSKSLTKLENIKGSLLLPFKPKKTIIAIKSIEPDYENKLELYPSKNITILDVKYQIDSSIAKAINFDLITLKNESKVFYKNILISVILYDSNDSLISEEKIFSKRPISPGEEITLGPITIGAVGTEKAEYIKLSILDAELISPKVYVKEGGAQQDLSIFESDDSYLSDVPIILKDLDINNFDWVTKAKNTIGFLSLNIENTSNFDYSNIVFEIYFLNERGSTINKRNFKYKKSTILAKSSEIIKINAGLIDFDFSNIEIVIISGDSILNNNVKNKLQENSSKNIKTREIKKTNIEQPESLVELEDLNLEEYIIVVDYLFDKQTSSFRIMNLSDFDLKEIKLKVTNNNNEELLFSLKNIKKRSEKRYFGLKPLNFKDLDGKKLKINVISAFK